MMPLASSITSPPMAQRWKYVSVLGAVAPTTVPMSAEPGTIS